MVGTGKTSLTDGVREVDPILWTKNGRFFATLSPVCQGDDIGLPLCVGPASGIAWSPGETEGGSAGEHPAKG